MLTFNLHIGDWWKSTAHLSDSERGIYLTLLLRYYDTEQPLPAEKTAVYRLACARNADAMLAVDVVLAEFFDLQGDGWHNKRADKEIAEYQVKREKAKRSAEVRWHGPRANDVQRPQSERNADALPTQSEGNANHEPLTNNHLSPDGDRTRASRSVTVTAAQLVSEYQVEEQVARDFLSLRKAKRAPLTPTALNGLIREFEKAQLTVAAGIQLCTMKGWQGFKSEWLNDRRTHGADQEPGRRLTAVDRAHADNERHRKEREGGRIIDA